MNNSPRVKRPRGRPKGSTAPKDSGGAMRIRKGNGAIVGRQIIRARKALDMSQRAFADALNALPEVVKPYSYQAVSKWEKGGRENFNDNEIESFTRVLGRDRDFFVTDSEAISRAGNKNNLPDIDETRNDAVAYRLPVLKFEMIRHDTMEALIAGHTGEYHTPKHPPAKGGDGYSFTIQDDSMEPLAIKGETMLSFEIWGDPDPGNVIHAELPDGATVIRVFEYEGDKVVLAPYNPRWSGRVNRFSIENFEKTVKILGVLVDISTPGRRSFSLSR